MTLTYFLVKFVSFLTGEELDYAKAKERSSDEMGCHGVCKHRLCHRRLRLSGNSDTNTPLVISHRGVSNKNGVQNTVQSLEKNSSTKTRSHRNGCVGNERRSVRDDARC